MTTILWIVQGLLALTFIPTGGAKVLKTREGLIPGMPFVEDFKQSTVRTIRALEILGAVGVIVPALTRILPELLTSLAASGLVLTMVGAAVMTSPHSLAHS